MKHQKMIIITGVLLAGVVTLAVSGCDSHPAEDDGHAHTETEVRNDSESVHEEEPAIELTEEQIREIGIELAAATGGQIDVFLNLPGEVAVNADRMAHIVPRVPGVVVEVRKALGDAAKPERSWP